MRTRLTRRKRLVFKLAIVCATYICIEVISALLLTINNGGVTYVWNERHKSAGMTDVYLNEQTDADHVQTFLGEKVRPDMVHPYLGFVRQPAPAEDASETIGRVSPFGYNDSGSPLHVRTPEKLIVGIVGGSVAEQFAQNACEDIERALRELPKFADREFVFVRMALKGHKQPQQLMTIGYLLSLKAEFDILINIDGFNEVALPIAENVPNNVAPIFPRSWHVKIARIQNPNVTRLIGHTVHLKIEQQQRARFFSRFPLRYSLLAMLVWKNGHDAASREIIADYERLNRLARDDISHGAAGPEFEFADRAELNRHCVRLWSRSSVLLNQLCEANGIAYYHFLQPNQYVPDSKPMSYAEKKIALNPENPYRRPALDCYPLLIAEGKNLSAQGVRFNDLTDVFADHPETLYIDDCCHFSKQGDSILAKRIASVIRKDQK